MRRNESHPETDAAVQSSSDFDLLPSNLILHSSDPLHAASRRLISETHVRQIGLFVGLNLNVVAGGEVKRSERD